MLSKLMPKEGRFFEKFTVMADKILDGCTIFETMLDEWCRREAHTQDIYKIEHECDDLTHGVIDLVNTVFITPVDREDIQLLAKTMDDVIDYIKAVTQRLDLYEVHDVPPGLPAMARVLTQAMEEVKIGMNILKDMRHPQETLRHCIEINRLENECDTLVREHIGRLFREHKNDPLQVIKLKEIYETMDNAVDTCEDVANVLESMTIKYA